MSIKPEFQYLYDWEFEDKYDRVEAKIPIHSQFSPDCIKFLFDKNSSSITIYISGYVPIVCGTLFMSVKDVEREIVQSFLVFTFLKEENLQWPFLIVDFYPETESIDPKSAHILSHMLASSPNQEEKALKFVHSSIGSGYLPAILTAIQLFLNVEDRRAQVIDLLDVAANRYQDPSSIFQLGIVYYSLDSSREISIPYLARAMSLGYTEAGVYLAKIFSPNSGVSFYQKDEVRAMDLLRHVLNEKPNAQAYYEYAKILLNDDNYSSNHEEGRECLKKAQELDSSLPDITPKKSHITKILIALTATAAVAIAVYFKKSKKKQI